MSGADTPHRDYVGGLFRSHYPWLCARMRRHLDSRASAEDIAADTFVQLLMAPDVVPIRQPRALLTTIAQRLMYQRWRRRDLERAYLDVLQQIPDADVLSPEERAQMLEALENIDCLLDGLPDKVKATFLLSRVNGLTYPEIAAELGISQRSVSDYMTRASKVRIPTGEIPCKATIDPENQTTTRRA
ncbi:sigma-70 family RNA polymerase sigma factor [Pseudomonas gingeri]|uniref:sigma-70 family RNA polymerase sigma factor n=1 Tax=Pseudomonas gingeri TaxID=117681 RepID=UPI0015A235B4|nr:sigma-70 family RNA polymerase sigma factor [Pseudomonas gingeri]NWA27173.1 sigma-70 family RNA polymerase sigma factor [Pseudomonas gingeri]